MNDKDKKEEPKKKDSTDDETTLESLGFGVEYLD